jgi:hypothetical protein
VSRRTVLIGALVVLTLVRLLTIDSHIRADLERSVFSSRLHR